MTKDEADKAEDLLFRAGYTVTVFESPGFGKGKFVAAFMAGRERVFRNFKDVERFLAGMDMEVY